MKKGMVLVCFLFSGVFALDRQEGTVFACQLCDAVKSGNLEAVKKIVNNEESYSRLSLTKETYVNKADAQGLPPLYLGVQVGHSGIVRFLLDSGANLNAAVNENQFACLNLACQKGNKDIVKLLLAHDAAIPDPLPQSSNADIKKMLENTKKLREEDYQNIVNNDLNSLRPVLTLLKDGAIPSKRVIKTLMEKEDDNVASGMKVLIIQAFLRKGCGIINDEEAKEYIVNKFKEVKYKNVQTDYIENTYALYDALKNSDTEDQLRAGVLSAIQEVGGKAKEIVYSSDMFKILLDYGLSNKAEIARLLYSKGANENAKELSIAECYQLGLWKELAKRPGVWAGVVGTLGVVGFGMYKYFGGSR